MSLISVFLVARKMFTNLGFSTSISFKRWFLLNVCWCSVLKFATIFLCIFIKDY